MSDEPTFADVVRAARETLGNARRALTWLDTPCRALGNRRPLDVARSPEGRAEILRVLHRLEHGVIS